MVSLFTFNVKKYYVFYKLSSQTNSSKNTPFFKSGN